MRAGQLRHRVKVQNYTEAQDSGGAPIPTWTDLETVWAEIKPLAGREFVAAQQISSEITGTIRIRYLAGVTAKSRIIFGTKTYEIIAPVNIEERDTEWLLYVREGATSG